MEPAKVGKNGTVVLPSKLRKRVGLRAGTLITAEERDGGILIRPLEIDRLENYTPARIAEFLLNNAVDGEDYNRACAEVRALGLDPKKVSHAKPKKA